MLFKLKHPIHACIETYDNASRDSGQQDIKLMTFWNLKPRNSNITQTLCTNWCAQQSITNALHIIVTRFALHNESCHYLGRHRDWASEPTTKFHVRALKEVTKTSNHVFHNSAFRCEALYIINETSSLHKRREDGKEFHQDYLSPLQSVGLRLFPLST